MKRIAWSVVVLVLINRGPVPGAQCGNNVVESGEECEPPGSGCLVFSDPPEVCNAQCVCVPATPTPGPPPPMCGNNVVESGETCDPPGTTCMLNGGQFCNRFCVCATATPTTFVTRTPTKTPTPTPTPTPTRTPTRTATRTPTSAGPISLSISDPQQKEGLPAIFRVTLSGPRTVEVRVNYSTSDGTALSESDYSFSGGTLTFAPGVTSQTFSVTVINDTRVEPNETFFATLTSPFNAVIAKPKGTDTIIDNDGAVGTTALVPPESSVPAGVRTSLTLTWTHPVSWRDLDTVDLRLEDGDQVVLWVRFDQAQNTFSLCSTNDECGSGVAPETNQELRATSATLFLQGSHVQGSGPTGPSVDLTYAFSVDPTLAGRTLRIEAAATDDSGDSQDFLEVGTLTVNAAMPQFSDSDGCSLDSPHTPRRMTVWLALPFVAVLWRWGRVRRRRGVSSVSFGKVRWCVR